MRLPKPITFSALALILIQTTGCASLQPLQSPLPRTREAGRSAGVEIRVTKHDGEKIRLENAWMDRTHIGGIARRESLEIPLTEVVALEEKHTNVQRTITVLSIVVAIAYASWQLRAESTLLGGG